MSNDQTLREDVAYLRRVAEEGQSLATVSGSYMVLWGILSAVALGLVYLKLTQNLVINDYALWGGFTVLGWLGSLVLARRAGTRTRNQHPGGKIYGLLWGGSGLAVMIFGLGIGLSGYASPGLITMAVAAIFGLAFIVTAQLSHLRWLNIVGLAWWAAGFAMFFVPMTPNFLLISAALDIVLIALPGALLFISQKPEA